MSFRTIFGARTTSKELVRALNRKYRSETLARLGSEAAFPNGSRSALDVSHCTALASRNNQPILLIPML